MIKRLSHQAANNLFDLMDEDTSDYSDVEDAMGETDCEHGCYVEPDGVCPHGFMSAGLSAGVI
jgi:hypothetical protein